MKITTLFCLFSLLLGCEGLVSDPGGLPPDVPPGVVPPPPFEPGEAVFPRLTSVQYRNTLVDLFGPDLPATPVEADTNPYLFFNIGATSTTISEVGVQQYQDAAATVTDSVFANTERRDALLGCVPMAADDACVEGFLVEFGRRIYRRPLTADELQRWLAVSRDNADGDAFRGVRLAVYGMLQSPSFLYRVELGEPDPSDPTRRRYTGWEMAERLSYLFWNSMPDAELLDAAERGELVTDTGIYEQASRLLESPRARAAVQSFFAQYFDLTRLNEMDRDPASYPLFTDTLAASMRTEIELLVDDFVFRRDADIRELYSTRNTFVNEDLAALYGVDAPGASAIAFVPVELPADGPRAGVLTLGAFPAMNAHPTETSPTLRGKAIRERILCQSVPAPPGDIDLNLEGMGSTARTLRERLEQHRTDPVCAACHAFIDPPGMLFEHFDSIGAYRTEDSGYPVDSSGELDGIVLDGASDLGVALHEDPRVPRCLIQQLYRHAHGRLDESAEAAALVELESEFIASGYRFQDLMISLAVSEGFRSVAAQGGER